MDDVADDDDDADAENVACLLSIFQHRSTFSQSPDIVVQTHVQCQRGHQLQTSL